MAQQTAVEWLLEKICNEILDNEFINKLSIEKTHLFNKISTQAKAMEKEQIIEAINQVSQNNVKYANMIVASWSQIEGELFMHNTKQAEQYYNETYKNNNQ